MEKVLFFDPKPDDGNLPTSQGLPYGWTGPETNKETGRVYYRNHKTGQTRDKPPPRAPPTRSRSTSRSIEVKAVLDPELNSSLSGRRESAVTTGITNTSALDVIDDAELPVPPPAPTLPVPPPAPALNLPDLKGSKRIYKCLVDPGLGFRSETKWDSRVVGVGVELGDLIEGEEENSEWIYVPSKEYYLPIKHEGKLLLEADAGASQNRQRLLNDIKRSKGRNIGARAKLLSEISRGKSLKKTHILRDAGLLAVDSKIMQQAIANNLVSYEDGQRLWKFFQGACGRARRDSLIQNNSKMDIYDAAKKRFGPEELRKLVLKMKEELKPKTMTYVKKKYHNCISGAEVIFYLGDSKMTEGVDSEVIGTLLLDMGLIKSASSKKVNNIKGLPVRADQYYRYGDIVLFEGYLERTHRNMFHNSKSKRRYYKLVEAHIGSRSKRQEYRLESYQKKGDKDPHSSLDVTDAKLDPIPRLALDFIIKAGKEVRLSTKTQDDKKAWVEQFKRALGASQTITEDIPPVFGSRLSLVKKSSQNPHVPQVVWDCIEHIRTYGMTTEGVFRKAGLKDRVNEVKKGFDAGIEANFKEKGDVHNAAACLKQWLRELPEPLIPFDKYKAFLEAKDVDQYRKLANQIPIQNKELLGYLCTFLERLSLNHKITRMHKKNLALVFAPNILRPEREDAMEAFQNSDKKINTFAQIIENVYTIFGLERPVCKDAVNADKSIAWL